MLNTDFTGINLDMDTEIGAANNLKITAGDIRRADRMIGEGRVNVVASARYTWVGTLDGVAISGGKSPAEAVRRTVNFLVDVRLGRKILPAAPIATEGENVSRPAIWETKGVNG